MSNPGRKGDRRRRCAEPEPTKKRFTFACVKKHCVVSYGPCNLRFPCNKPGTFGAYSAILSLLPPLLVNMMTPRESEGEFKRYLKLISVNDPLISENCFGELVYRLTQMQTRAVDLGGVRQETEEEYIRRRLDPTVVQKIVLDSDSSEIDLRNYLAACRNFCEIYDTWMCVFRLGKALTDYYFAYRCLPPPNTGPLAKDCFKESVLTKHLEEILKSREFEIAGITYRSI